MEKNNIIIIILILVIIGILIIFYFAYHNKRRIFGKTNEIFIQSNINNKEYSVQNFENKDIASDILAIIDERIQILNNYFEKNMNKYPDYKPYLIQFCNRIKNLSLQETDSDSEYTSYTVNKGDEISLCLRSKKIGELHDINLIMYVVLHELSHVACPEEHHTELFKKIFAFFIQIAIMLGIYHKVNYQIDPHEYCGIIINEHIQ